MTPSREVSQGATMTADLELRRKVLEICGIPIAHDFSKGRIACKNCGKSEAVICDGLSVELDPGIAITTLDEFCKKHDIGWAMSGRDNRSVGVGLISLHEPERVRLSAEGATVAEAICLAIIEAAGRL